MWRQEAEQRWPGERLSLGALARGQEGISVGENGLELDCADGHRTL